MKIERQNKIKTEFGTASIIGCYYRIKSSKEGNKDKLLHRLIFEKFYGKIPEGGVVHHKDGDKTNNCIFNLQLMRAREHNSLHSKGENNPFFGKTHPAETRVKIGEARKGKCAGENHHNYGKTTPEETSDKISKSLKNYYIGKKPVNWKDYPRVIKAGFKRGKQCWALKHNGKIKKRSIFKEELDKEVERMIANNN